MDFLENLSIQSFSPRYLRACLYTTDFLGGSDIISIIPGAGEIAFIAQYSLI